MYKTLPGGFKFNNTLRSTYATMEDLLAHRTGIPRNNYARLASDYSIQSFARSVLLGSLTEASALSLLYDWLKHTTVILLLLFTVICLPMVRTFFGDVMCGARCIY